MEKNDLNLVENPSRLVLCGSKDIFVFNVKDWSFMRRKLRINGRLVGNINLTPSLPLKLLPEEAHLLLETNSELCETNEDTATTNLEQFEEQFLEAQQQATINQRKQELESLINKIEANRRKNGDLRSKQEIFEEELSKCPVITKYKMLWPILMDDCRPRPLDKEHINTLTTPFKLEVYKDLWKKDYHVTSGEKFGGDFLVYLGDPIMHHAVFIVKSVDEDETFTSSDLIAFGRLGVSVKKKASFGSVQDGVVKYLSINWIDA